MLDLIARRGGTLTDDERRECQHLEAGIRDEIRGRRLLNDRVRAAVLDARRRGAVVTLFDEGGLDDVEEGAMDGALTELAEAIAGTRARRIIARTAPADSGTAITVVGLTPAGESSVSELGSDDEEGDDDEVDLWLEIPKPS
jgi:hypothetical protein